MQQKTKPLKSLSIFFPFYNDAGTVEQAISGAFSIGSHLTNRLEVIALYGGKSVDDTFAQILKMQRKYRSLKIIDRTSNLEGYAVIKYGLVQSTSDWVFYTDGDLQYNLVDLIRLVKKQLDTNADVINGFKINRGDKALRTTLGELYKKLTKIVFKIPISDPTCDFRLIKSSFLKQCPLFSSNASICVELIKELQLAGAKFTEIPVRHRRRKYGKSNYKPFSLLLERFFGDLLLWIRLRRRYNK